MRASSSPSSRGGGGACCSRRCARIRSARRLRIIGEIVADEHCFVQMTTAFGGGRIIDWLSGEQLPRIC